MMDELWDLLDASRQPLGRTHRRGDPLPEGCYHLVVHVWVRNSAGEILISKRHPDKVYGNLWACTGGSVTAGEDSRTGAARELAEELGLALPPENARLLYTHRRTADFVDEWFFEADAPLEALRFQPDEVTAARWVTPDQLRALDAAGKWLPEVDYEKALAAM